MRTHRFAHLLTLFWIFLLSVMCIATAAVAMLPIPHLKEWEDNMVRYGAKHLHPMSEVNEQDVWYYDGIKVYYQIAEYTKDTHWRTGAQYAKELYRDKLVLPNDGKIGGWRLFPHGLYLDYGLTGADKSKQAALLIARNGAFADRKRDYSATSRYDLRTVGLSREVAYNIHCYHVARDLGDLAFRGPDPYIDFALGHLDAWLDWLGRSPRPTYPYTPRGATEGFQPFMVGLTMEALIRYAERRDADTERKNRSLHVIAEAARLMWDVAWLQESEAFYYESNARRAAPDLNLLIAPAYAWVWHKTGEQKYLVMADKMFAGGVKRAWLDGGKQFSQNYRWSFDYIKWRSGKPRGTE